MLLARQLQTLGPRKIQSLPIGSTYTHIYHKSQQNVPKYTSPMDSMG